MASDTAVSNAKAAAESAPADAAPGAKPRRRLVLVLAGVLAALAIGAGAWYFLNPRDAEPAAEAAKGDKKGAKGKAEPAKPAKPSVFINLDAFTVNLRAEQDGDRYLQLGVVFEVAGSDVSDAVKASMPVIRSRILLNLTAKTAAELQATEGKTRLAEELLAIARTALPGGTAAKSADKGVIAAHFSAFVIQ